MAEVWLYAPPYQVAGTRRRLGDAFIRADSVNFIAIRSDAAAGSRLLVGTADSDEQTVLVYSGREDPAFYGNIHAWLLVTVEEARRRYPNTPTVITVEAQEEGVWDWKIRTLQEHADAG